MYHRIRIGSFLFVFYFRKLHNTGGLNSILKDGSHFPCFDFDNSNIREVKRILQTIQEKYNLSQIIIWNTGRADSYNAIALSRKTFRECLQIAFDTEGIDENFIKFAIWRKHFTLRILPKNKRKPEIVEVLHSDIAPTVTRRDITSFTLYETGSG